MKMEEAMKMLTAIRDTAQKWNDEIHNQKGNNSPQQQAMLNGKAKAYYEMVLYIDEKYTRFMLTPRKQATPAQQDVQRPNFTIADIITAANDPKNQVILVLIPDRATMIHAMDTIMRDTNARAASMEHSTGPTMDGINNRISFHNCTVYFQNVVNQNKFWGMRASKVFIHPACYGLLSQEKIDMVLCRERP